MNIMRILDNLHVSPFGMFPDLPALDPPVFLELSRLARDLSQRHKLGHWQPFYEHYGNIR